MPTNTLFDLKQKNKLLTMTSWERGLPISRGKPLRFTLNTSYKCNFRCIMCQYHRKPEISKRVLNRQPVFSSDTYSIFLEEIFPTLIEAETTTVGEPFYSKFFKLTLQKAREFQVKLYTTTNGSLLTEKNIANIYDLLSTLVISIDGASKESYEKIRKKGDFDKLVKNIQRFMEIRLNSEIKPQVTFQMTLMNNNIEDLPKMIYLANEYGIDNVKAYHAYIYDEDMKNESLFFHKRRYNDNLQKAKEIAIRFGINVFLPKKFALKSKFNDLQNKTGFTKPPCRFLWTEGFLEPTGDITACFFPYKYKLGNINNNKFESVWNNDLYQELRRKVSLPIPHKYCKNCELRNTYLPNYSGSTVREDQFILTDDERLDFFR